jgi:hypothetical protein
MAEQSLAQLWERARRVGASANEIMDAISATRRAQAVDHTDDLMALLGHHDAQGRAYAMLALVLDLHQSDAAIRQHCWNAVTGDEEEDVRAKAAVCLSTLYHGTRDRSVFLRLKEVVQTSPSRYVRDAAYEALFHVAGEAPQRWPSFRSLSALDSTGVLPDFEIDWDAIAEMERKTEPEA